MSSNAGVAGEDGDGARDVIGRAIVDDDRLPVGETLRLH
jgi:hypothetical protein